jgi:flagellar basal-body rod modification protein FlgD
MTTVQNNTASQSVLSTLQSATGTGTDKSVTADAQDRFMTLLVTQMKNQDPLNPLDNAQVTSQLAQLSTVSGIEKMNSTLQTLMGSYQSSQSLQAAGMIGHGVLVTGSKVALSDGKAVLGFELAEPADKVVVTIRDTAGNAVRTIDMGAREAGATPLAWDGTRDDGGTAADGKYVFDVAATRGGEKLDATALSFGEVTSVSTGAQGVKLNMTGLDSASLADVRQIL